MKKNKKTKYVNPDEVKPKREYRPYTVNIFTDASHLPHSNSTTCAYFVRYDWGYITNKKKCPADINNVHDAEAYAICQALYHTLNHFKKNGYPVKEITIKTDSQTAIKYLTNNKIEEFWRDTTIRLRTAFDKMKAELGEGFPLKIKHIKGHQSKKSSTAAYVNNWCDKMARKAH